MATRDKLREKRIYGCEGDPMPAIGLGNIRMDNGPALRNSKTIGAMVGLGATATAVRTYSPTDKPYIERLFGTIESVLLQMIHGYTGRKAGHLPGYDAKRNGVLNIEELYGILTRYLIDEYPSTPHTGFGMWGRRPAEVAHHINDTRGCFQPVDPVRRLISLGWKQEVTPNDEGVRVFTGLRYHSPMLQKAKAEEKENDSANGKASVFVDPDDLTNAVVLLPKVKDPIEVHLQSTCFRSLTIFEMLALLADLRREDPRLAKIHEDRVLRVWRDRTEMLEKIAARHGLPSSSSTLEFCKKTAARWFSEVQVVPSDSRLITTPPGNVTLPSPGGAVFQIGPKDRLIEGTLSSHMPTGSDVAQEPIPAAIDAEQPMLTAAGGGRRSRSPRPQAKLIDEPQAIQRLGRPKTLGTFE